MKLPWISLVSAPLCLGKYILYMVHILKFIKQHIFCGIFLYFKSLFPNICSPIFSIPTGAGPKNFPIWPVLTLGLALLLKGVWSGSLMLI